MSNWDRDILAIEYQALQDLQFDDIEITGFSLGEIDTIWTRRPRSSRTNRVQRTTFRPSLRRRFRGRAICGSSVRTASCAGMLAPRADYARLLAGETADLVLTDPPFNVRVDGNVSGLGKVRHEEFAMASGEMSEAEFTAFLSHFSAVPRPIPGTAPSCSCSWTGGTCSNLTCAGREQGLTQKNLIVWAKDNAGMGTFYRSRHELVFVFKNGDAAHTNTFELGQHGRYRTNVWEYAGVNTFRAGRLTNSPCTRPSSRSPCWRTRSGTSPGAATSCSIRLPAAAAR